MTADQVDGPADDAIKIVGDFLTAAVHDTGTGLVRLLDIAKGLREDYDRWATLISPMMPHLDRYEADWFLELAIRRVRADQALLVYVGRTAKVFPMAIWSVQDIVKATVAQVRMHAGSLYILDCELSAIDYHIQCPAFVTHVILASLLFRYPASKPPLELVLKSVEGTQERDRRVVDLSLSTKVPPNEECLAFMQIEPDRRWKWDGWHHSWSFAESTAREYLGSCQSWIDKGGNMHASVTLPAEVGDS